MKTQKLLVVIMVSIIMGQSAGLVTAETLKIYHANGTEYKYQDEFEGVPIVTDMFPLNGTVIKGCIEGKGHKLDPEYFSICEVSKTETKCFRQDIPKGNYTYTFNWLERPYHHKDQILTKEELNQQEYAIFNNIGREYLVKMIDVSPPYLICENVIGYTCLPQYNFDTMEVKFNGGYLSDWGIIPYDKDNWNDANYMRKLPSWTHGNINGTTANGVHWHYNPRAIGTGFVYGKYTTPKLNGNLAEE